ncbi:hypothetical protein [Empedobacter tilapiae]|uniref:hypothetical protein n=1 Tax=Empedobacter tilapiae TaxID=2491114 RepID=UPI001FECCF44|nr:hypothetical protein [Empedobacter tilapiae]
MMSTRLKTVNEDHYYPFGLQHKGYNKPPKDIIGGIGEGEVEIGIGLGTSSGSANYKYKTMIIELKVLSELLANIPHEVLNYKRNLTLIYTTTALVTTTLQLDVGLTLTRWLKNQDAFLLIPMLLTILYSS